MTQAVTSATAPHVGLTRVWVDDGAGDLGARVLRRISSADDVEQGDWSLLDVVKSRSAFWRKDR